MDQSTGIEEFDGCSIFNQSEFFSLLKPKLKAASVNTGSASEYIRYPSHEWKRMAVFNAINAAAEPSALLTPNSASPHHRLYGLGQLRMVGCEQNQTSTKSVDSVNEAFSSLLESRHIGSGLDKRTAGPPTNKKAD